MDVWPRMQHVCDTNFMNVLFMTLSRGFWGQEVACPGHWRSCKSMLTGRRRTSQCTDDLLPISKRWVWGGVPHLSLGLSSSSFQINFIKKPYIGDSYQLLRLTELLHWFPLTVSSLKLPSRVKPSGIEGESLAPKPPAHLGGEKKSVQAEA